MYQSRSSNHKEYIPLGKSKKEYTPLTQTRMVRRLGPLTMEEKLQNQSHLKLSTSTLPQKTYLADKLKPDSKLLGVLKTVTTSKMQERLGIDREDPYIAAGRAQGAFIAQKNPKLVDPQAYFESELSRGWKHQELPEAVTKEQRRAQTMGRIFGYTTLQAVMSPVIGAASTKLLAKSPATQTAIQKVATLAQQKPWTVGWGLQILKGGAWGGLLGTITQADTKKEWIQNVAHNAGWFAAFNAITYPIVQFFKPLMYEVSKGGRLVGDKNIQQMISSKEVKQIVSSPKTLYYKHPTDPKLLLKVTEQQMMVVNATGSTSQYPLLTKQDIEVFRYEPALFTKLHNWLTRKTPFQMVMKQPIKPIDAKWGYVSGDPTPPTEAAKTVVDVSGLGKPIPTPTVPTTPITNIDPASILTPITQERLTDSIAQYKTPDEFASQNKPSMNIRMDIGEAKDALQPQQIIDILKKEFDISVNNYKIKPSESENIFIPELSRPITEKELLKLADLLKQDAIPAHDGQKGMLVGPKAEEWGGKFLSEYYLNQEGEKFSDLISAYNRAVGTVDTLQRIKMDNVRTHKGVQYQALESPESKLDVAIDGDNVGWLTNLETKEEFRRQGFGEEIIKHGINSLINRGVTEIKVVPESTISRNLFKKVGFVGDGKEMTLEIATPKLPDVTPNIQQTLKRGDSPSVAQNQAYNQAQQKLKTNPAQITKQDMQTLRDGKREEITPDGIKEVNPESEIHNEIIEMYAGLNPAAISEMPLEQYNQAKKWIIDNIAKGIIKYVGLTPEIKELLMGLEGSKELLKEDLLKFFTASFGNLSPTERELLSYHQENPKKYPIPPHLESSAKLVNELVQSSRALQESRNLQTSFFPESFIAKQRFLISELKDEIIRLKQGTAIQKRLNKIKLIEQDIELLKQLRYMPHAYLTQQGLERKMISQIDGYSVSAALRDTLTKLKGRKITTLDVAEELGLKPEKDAAVLLASHFEYLLNKISIHDTVEAMKANTDMVLPEEVAPKDWHKLPVKQLDGYLVHPWMSASIEELAIPTSRTMIGRAYDSVNALGKALRFHNFIILPFWNVIQTIGGGTGFLGWRSFINLVPDIPNFLKALLKQEDNVIGALMPKAIREVQSRGPLYRDLVRRGVYTTPLSQRMPESIETMIKIQLAKMDKDYPGWKKAFAKITGREPSLKSILLIPDLYRANWNLTWSIDRIQRTATALGYLRQGADINQAAEMTKTFHADYNIFAKNAKKWINRGLLVGTYKTNMLVRLPAFIARNMISLGKNVTAGKKPTQEEKAAFTASMNIFIVIAAALSFAAYRGYRLREGYRLVKKLDKPEITKEGEFVTERVITLPGPWAEIPKFLTRLMYGPQGIYMYLAVVPQIGTGLARNRRWNGDPYWTIGASPEYQKREIITNIARDYFSFGETIERLTDTELDSIDKTLSMVGFATYKRGSTESRIQAQISQLKSNLNSFLKRPDISEQNKEDAIQAYEERAKELIDELESFMEIYE